MRLAVGTLVVYGAHGVGRIAARATQTVLGEEREVVVVELEEGLTVTLPLERAREQLRALASAADLRRVQEALRGERDLSSDTWLSRRRDAVAKLTGGDPIELAEIVGDGARRERERKAKGHAPRLSPGELEVYTRAWKLLSGEIARARGVDRAAADGWIAAQLDRAG